MLNVALIDDESSARAVARELIQGHFSQVKIVAEAGGVEEGYNMLIKTKPDLLLLDIDMPDGTGFDLLNRWDNPPFKVIFVTAFDHFAIKAFQFAALDYLLKPLDPSALILDIQKLLAAQRPLDQQKIQLEALYGSLQANYADRLLIPYQSGYHIIPLTDLLFIQAEGSYSFIFPKNRSKIMSSRPIAQYEELLPGNLFQRVHQSYLLNLHEVRAFDLGDEMQATLSDGQKVPVSRRKKQAFVEALKKLALG